MSSPAHSLHVAVAAPATTPSVWQPHLCRDTPQKAISLSCFTPCDLAVKTPRRYCKEFRATCFAFLCSPPPVWAFRSETTSGTNTGRRGAYLFAFPCQRGCGIASDCFIGFALAEKLEEAGLHETQAELP
jgi:hypothetical protein